MNRRNFFRSLSLMAGAASVSPQIFIPKFEPVRWKARHVPPWCEGVDYKRCWQWVYGNDGVAEFGILKDHYLHFGRGQPGVPVPPERLLFPHQFPELTPC